MRLIQLRHASQGRRVALVEEPSLRLIAGHQSIYALAVAAIAAGKRLVDFAPSCATSEKLDYAAIYDGRSDWRILPAFDHPIEPARCHVAGTGLTHINSAKQRDAMHAKANATAAPLTDSMKMFQWGIEGGKPSAGIIGVQPEWFYKGNGHILRAHGEPLEVPAFADDGGDEGEIAGVYLIDLQGQPRRVGLVTGNEFADHQMERKNYLYLAPSKLRHAAIGPELVVDPDFADVRGHAVVRRGAQVVWERDIASGHANMSHSLENLEHHQFKYAQHRVPGDVHIHFFGADAFSFGTGTSLHDGDLMEIAWTGFGRPLRNPLRVDRSKLTLARVTPV